MSPIGGQEKTFEPTVSKELALNDAIAHIKQLWRTYREAYEDNYYERE